MDKNPIDKGVIILLLLIALGIELMPAVRATLLFRYRLKAKQNQAIGELSHYPASEQVWLVRYLLGVTELA